MFPDINQRTPLDLNFSIFRVAVRVHPLHWVTNAMMGWGFFQLWGVFFLLVWIACVFLAVLTHELGHVFAGRFFGSNGHILLTSFGGLAIGSNNLRKRWQRIVVAAGGPAIQLLVFGLMWLTEPHIHLWLISQSEYLQFAYFIFMYSNLGWALFNLLPIYPLDGGQIARELCEGVRPTDGTMISLVISAIVAGLLAVEAFLSASGRGFPFLSWLPFHYCPLTGIFLLLFCLNNLQEMQMLRQRRRNYDDRFPWE